MFKRKKKNKEVIELERSYYTLNTEDVIKFYSLLKCYNESAINIGIIGDKHKFEYQMRNILEALKNKSTKIIQNKEGTRVRILLTDDREFDYYHIQTLSDLGDLKFKKFI